jgi:hypothetical protein
VDRSRRSERADAEEKELEDLRFTAHATSRELKTIKDRYEASLADVAAQTQAGVPTLAG